MNQKSPQKSVCFYFQVHQPYRISDCSFFSSEDQELFKGPEKYFNEDIFNKVAEKCYIPATKMFLDLAKKNKEFRIAYSISGVFLDQCEEYPKYGKKIIKLFKDLAKTGQCEFLAETYYHSLSFLYSKLEWAEQIKMHSDKIKKLFGQKPKIFRNTELIYSNELAEFIREMGYKGMIAEGWDTHMKDKSSNYLYYAKSIELRKEESLLARKYATSKTETKNLPLLLKNYKLSDDVAFRFSNKSWEEFPLYIDKYASWIGVAEGETINLFMDYETIGEHQWEDTGIFDFFKALPDELKRHNIGFHTPSEAIKKLEAKHEYDVHNYLSWADMERDLSAWVDNDIQRSALEELQKMEGMISPYFKTKNKELKKLINGFRRLTTSDHLYYMCTKYWSDGDVHKYFSPYESPYEAYINFMNTIRLLEKKLQSKLKVVTSSPCQGVSSAPIRRNKKG